MNETEVVLLICTHTSLFPARAWMNSVIPIIFLPKPELAELFKYVKSVVNPTRVKFECAVMISALMRNTAEP